MTSSGKKKNYNPVNATAVHRALVISVVCTVDHLLLDNTAEICVASGFVLSKVCNMAPEGCQHTCVQISHIYMTNGLPIDDILLINEDQTNKVSSGACVGINSGGGIRISADL